MALNMSNRPRDNRPPLEHRFSGEHPLRTLVYLYHGQRGQLAVASLCFVIKHSPVWLMPAITANIVDIVAQPAHHARSELWINALVLALILAQNVPLHYVYARALSRAARTTETNLRSALCRRLQHL